MMHNNSIVWKKSMDLAVLIYSFVKQLPGFERYGLVSQMQRAVTSIPSNIAEGSARGSTKDYIRFLRISQSSLKEVETQYQLCILIHHCKPDNEIEDKLDHIGKLLTNLIKSLKAKNSPN